MKRVMEEVGGKVSVTFHKASDSTSDLLKTVHLLEKYGVNRVLTQGGTTPILQNLETLNGIIGFNSV